MHRFGPLTIGNTNGLLAREPVGREDGVLTGRAAGP
jgi:hypothetical protein